MAHWLVGIPAASVAAFVMGVGFNGLWGGIGIGLVVQCSILAVVVFTVDWEAEARTAVLRAADTAEEAARDSIKATVCCEDLEGDDVASLRVQ